MPGGLDIHARQQLGMPVPEGTEYLSPTDKLLLAIGTTPGLGDALSLGEGIYGTGKALGHALRGDLQKTKEYGLMGGLGLLGALPFVPSMTKNLPIPTASKVVQRIEEPGIVPSFTKPQGLYLSPGEVVSPHSDLGGELFLYNWHPSNALDVTGQGEVWSRGRGVLAPESVGIKAARELVSDKSFQNLMRADKESLIDVMGRIYPEVDWRRYYDEQEIIEGFAGLAARERGHDALLDLSGRNPEFREYVALSEKAASPYRNLDVVAGAAGLGLASQVQQEMYPMSPIAGEIR